MTHGLLSPCIDLYRRRLFLCVIVPNFENLSAY